MLALFVYFREEMERKADEKLGSLEKQMREHSMRK